MGIHLKIRKITLKEKSRCEYGGKGELVSISIDGVPFVTNIKTNENGHMFIDRYPFNLSDQSRKEYVNLRSTSIAYHTKRYIILARMMKAYLRKYWGTPYKTFAYITVYLGDAWLLPKGLIR